jgi:hypothetical protein
MLTMLPGLSKCAPARELETLPEDSPVCDFCSLNDYNCDRERHLIDQDKRRQRRRTSKTMRSSSSDAGSDERDAEIERLRNVIASNHNEIANKDKLLIGRDHLINKLLGAVALMVALLVAVAMVPVAAYFGLL